jgi:putative ABC transport system substrate-binding protein
MKRRDLLLLGGVIIVARDLYAQQKTIPVIGYLSGSSAGSSAASVAAFRQGLSEIGYVEGQNVAIIYRWAEGRYDRLPVLAADLVSRNVDVITTSGGTDPALAARNATAIIPIVFGVSGNPEELGLVSSFARPSGNLTGIYTFNANLTSKRIELLSELLPEAKVIALLVNPNASPTARVIRDVQEAARAKGLQLHVLKAEAEGDFEIAFASLVQLQVRGLLVGTDAYFLSQRDRLVALAKRDAVPAMYEWREFTAAGGLMSYGASLAASYRQQGVYVGKMLKGARPADLPVWQSTKIELVINLKTANALGLTIPPSISGRADELME